MPALCFDTSNGFLAVETQPVLLMGHLENLGCFFYDYQKFGQREVARSYQCMRPGHPTIEAKIVDLVLEPKADPTLFTLANGVKETTNCPDPINPPKAVYEEVPRPAKDSGTISISMLIGIDGEPRILGVLNAASDALREVALEAVQRWRFRPANCDGEPVEAKIAIEIDIHNR